MEVSRRKVFVVLVAIALAAGVSLATVLYLTGPDEVTPLPSRVWFTNVGLTAGWEERRVVDGTVTEGTQDVAILSANATHVVLRVAGATTGDVTLPIDEATSQLTTLASRLRSFHPSELELRSYHAEVVRYEGATGSFAALLENASYLFQGSVDVQSSRWTELITQIPLAEETVRRVTIPGSEGISTYSLRIGDFGGIDIAAVERWTRVEVEHERGNLALHLFNVHDFRIAWTDRVLRCELSSQTSSLLGAVIESRSLVASSLSEMVRRDEVTPLNGTAMVLKVRFPAGVGQFSIGFTNSFAPVVAADGRRGD